MPQVCAAPDCQWNMGLLEGKASEVVSCVECNRRFHFGCLDLTKIAYIIQEYQWLCEDCSTCWDCCENFDEDDFFHCLGCDRGWHPNCYAGRKDDEPVPSEGKCEKCENFDSVAIATIGPVSSAATPRSHQRPSRRPEKRVSRPRPYPAKLPLVSSELRPRVLARDRLRLWKPGCSPHVPVAYDNVPLPFSDADIQRVCDLLDIAFSEKVLESYGSGLLHYHVFCDKKKVPEDQRAPASVDLLRFFIASLAGSYREGTIRSYRLLLRAAKNVAPPPKEKRSPLMVEDMERLRGALDLDDPLQAASWGALVTTFWCTARCGEFTLQKLSSFLPGKHVKLSDYRHTRSSDGSEAHTFHLPSTKCAPVDGEDVYFIRQSGPANPVDAFENHCRTVATFNRSCLPSVKRATHKVDDPAFSE
ncbi:unnamed protein product [Peniophora sp. CBMAI 1063]|nr:unnamed protein product [Peniophora sp. CBMAI 1063]